MDVETLQKELLKLPVEDRARLARELLDSLEDLSTEELERLWLEETDRRAAEIDAGEVELVSSEELDRKVQAVLRR